MKARENPFSTDRLERLSFRQGQAGTVDVAARLASMGLRAAIVGPKGSGKTTLLEALARKLSSGGSTVVFLRLCSGGRGLPFGFWRRRLSPDDVVLLDGAEQLSRWAWRLFLLKTRGCGGLVVTSHRPGLLPTLIECGTTPALLSELAGELLGRPPAPERIRASFARAGGDIRAAFLELYDTAC